MSGTTGPDGKRRYTVAQIAAEFSVTRTTIYRHLECLAPALSALAAAAAVPATIKRGGHRVRTAPGRDDLEPLGLHQPDTARFVSRMRRVLPVSAGGKTVPRTHQKKLAYE